jgi:transcriptional regulator with XRE-family HTH domain
MSIPPLPRWGDIDHTAKAKVFCAWIKERRIAKGLTQLELANLMGCSQSHVSKMEAGKLIPNVDLLDGLRDYEILKQELEP